MDWIQALPTLTLAACLLGMLAAYCYHARRCGHYRISRIDADQRQGPLSGFLMRIGYWSLQPLLYVAIQVGWHPAVWTICGLAAGLTAALALAFNWPGVALLLLAISTLFDMLDGAVARFYQLAGPLGSRLDRLADCLVEFGVLLGLAVSLSQTPPIAALAAGCALLPWLLPDSISPRRGARLAVLGSLLGITSLVPQNLVAISHFLPATGVIPYLVAGVIWRTTFRSDITCDESERCEPSAPPLRESGF